MLGRSISHYRILEKLGQGGMGEVYLAEDTNLGHRVAIKRLPSASTHDPSQRARFKREAMAVAHLSHPNVLTLHEYDEIDGELYVVMEYAPGGSLQDRLVASGDPLSVDQVMRWGVQAAEALAAAHAKDILHRDIKPANLLLSDSGDLKIADFGLARAMADTQITQTGAVLGTLAFMSPEQMAGQPLGTESDIFSLGATLHELLVKSKTGRGIAAYATATMSIDSIRASRPDLPEGLPELLTEMMAMDASQRISSAKEVATRLRAIRGSLSEDATVATSSVGRRKPGRFRARNLWLALLGVGIFGAALYGLRREPSTQGPSTVAVLPLRDVSPDGSQSMLAAGLTEAIISDLGRIHSISVISRRSAESFAGSDLTAKEIGTRLGADTILDASILRAGNRIEIRAALVETDSDRNVWTTTFERELSDVIAIQHEIALAIADGIRAKLGSDEAEALRSVRQVDPVAFERYIQARALWRARTRDGLLEAVSIYRDLTESHPDFVEAWVGLADAMVVIPSYTEVTTRVAYPEARRCALRAIEIDGRSAGAWNVLAEIAAVHDFDYEESERLRRKSLELNPSSVSTRQWFAEFLAALGRYEEALEQMRVAQRLDPLFPLVHMLESGILVYAGRFDEAVRKLDELLQEFPESGMVQGYQTWVLRKVGRQLDRAFAADLAARVRGGLGDEDAQALREAYAESGYLGVERELNRILLAALDAGEPVKARYMVQNYLQLGDLDKCFEWLEKSYEDRDIWLLRLKVDPVFDPIRSDPRFEEMMTRIHLSSGVRS